MKPANDIKGFTLLEILIAISLFAALTAMLYPAYIGTFHNMDITESHASVYRMARIAIDRISEDLACACIPGTDEDGDSDLTYSHAFLGTDSELYGRNADSLEFISEEHLPFNDAISAGRGRIKYYIKEHEDEDGFILYRSDNLELGNKSEYEETGELILCKDVNSLNYTYWDEDGEDSDYWDSSSGSSKGKLPSMVTVELEFRNEFDPELPIKFITSISIPMAMRKYGP
ncbi:MAG: prepilin-type N-terminal cleavage/methylation domain-containing protein [Deltaproteobacteria bacterium]|nr:prepilin-type N-terminal cleavage/methylation domain-containing protein [Deltaproteobacteria bacterium]